MKYKETIEFLYSQVPMFQNLGAGAYKPGLDTTRILARAWGNPHTKFPTIHIAGTNGKGSTASTIAAVLQSAGYRTALYTSPHLLDFRERIRINGEMIPESFVVDFVERYRADEDLCKLHPTFFELTTIMAFSWFAQEDIDVAVIEVGLGGRLDCTNIITPLLSVITNISLDHTALLGGTEAEIAREKAGIIKPNVPVVIGRAEGDVLKVFENVAQENHAPLHLAWQPLPYKSATHNADAIVYDGTQWGTVLGELVGECQTENAATIMTALPLIAKQFPAINATAVCNGFANVCRLSGLSGRWMQIATSPVRVICDTGHNVGGWQWLGPALDNIANNGKLHMVLGFVNDKDINGIMHLMPRQATYRFATPSVNRGRDASSTAEAAAQNGIRGTAFKTVADAYIDALNTAQKGDTIFIGGSTFVVADLLEHLQNNK